jgi:hypothetical protein
VRLWIGHYLPCERPNDSTTPRHHDLTTPQPHCPTPPPHHRLTLLRLVASVLLVAALAELDLSWDWLANFSTPKSDRAENSLRMGHADCRQLTARRGKAERAGKPRLTHRSGTRERGAITGVKRNVPESDCYHGRLVDAGVGCLGPNQSAQRRPTDDQGQTALAVSRDGQHHRHVGWRSFRPPGDA